MEATPPVDLQLNVAARALHPVERRMVSQLALTRAATDPFVEQARDLPQRHYQNFALLALVRVDFVIADPERLLRRLRADRDRDELYDRLLRAGAPRAMLQRCFAKSRRVIEADRARAGVLTKGRPPALATELAYQVLGAWDAIEADIGDFAERVAIVAEAFPDVSLASICRLLEDLRA
ncbi:MAG: DUF2857 family protein [Betaproteobacteria bacterium AqS2]|uniref:DUF2857 family protein n=1 Tax=Candidatus Amphirhobacter heronislandensis TaxID=1732024 RepID=A0A930Y3F9_9GAMM|nr:DUF2857 family protein [Betaproteobacteria bacterium AqS2]